MTTILRVPSHSFSSPFFHTQVTWTSFQSTQFILLDSPIQHASCFKDPKNTILEILFSLNMDVKIFNAKQATKRIGTC